MRRGDPQIRTRRIDGTRAEAEFHEAGDRGAIALHGFASDRRELGPLPAALAGAGLTTLAPDLRGHGASEGPPGRLSRERVLADLTAWRDELAEAGAELSLIAGHSLGGLWALYAAPELEPDAVAAIASPASIRSELSGLEIAGYRAAGAVDRLWRGAGGSTRRVPYDVGLDELIDHPRALERVRRMDLLQETVPLTNVPELLAVDGPAWAARVEGPALVAHGCRDAYIDRESTHRVYEALPGEKTWLELPGPHSLFLDVEAEECARRVAAWADERTG